jgi:LL-diaminopimelate aminotransferase
VEFRSYSKTAGFTGIRCGYTVVPKTLRLPLNALWSRRQSTKFNGASYLAQRAAEAIYTPEGKAQVKATVAYYMDNAREMREALTHMRFKVYGGIDAPYLWVETPRGMTSWEFFDLMLRNAQVVCTPGAGFGSSGEGYVRLTAFGTHENTAEALRRITDNIQNH